MFYKDWYIEEKNKNQKLYLDLDIFIKNCINSYKIFLVL
jgi:hypothetical protein